MESNKLGLARFHYLEALSGTPYAKIVSDQDILQLVTACQNLICLMQVELSAKTAEIEKLRMEISNRDSQCATATGDNNLLMGVKNLREPLRVIRSGREKVEGKPEAIFDATEVNRGEKLGGLNVEQSLNCHKVNQVNCTISLEYLKKVLREIEREVITDIVSDHKALKERTIDHRLVDAWTDCKSNVLYAVLHKVIDALE